MLLVLAQPWDTRRWVTVTGLVLEQQEQLLLLVIEQQQINTPLWLLFTLLEIQILLLFLLRVLFHRLLLIHLLIHRQYLQVHHLELILFLLLLL